MYGSYNSLDGQFSTDAGNLKKITLAVERELLGIDTQQMCATGLRYRVNVHSRFSIAENKGYTTSKMIRKDSSGSDILVKGPYASTVEEAIAGLETDLGYKILQKAAEPEKAADSEWRLKPLTKATGESGRDEPELPCSTWAGVNVSLVSEDDLAREKAYKEAEGEEGQCHGEYAPIIEGPGFLAGFLGRR